MMNETLPAEIEYQLKQIGPVLNVPATLALYKPLLACQPKSQVGVAENIAYGSDEHHRMDIYSPEKIADKKHPVLIFVHGGGFIGGDKASVSNQGYFYARQGMMVIVPNYRLAPQSPWPAGAEDISSVLSWTYAHIADLGGDPEQIIIAGESAGAAHVATATLIRQFHPAEGLNIAGAILISGDYNARLEHLARDQFGITTPDPFGDAYFGTPADNRAAMSTVELIDADPFPLFISYAERDMVQMQVQTGELFARLVTHHGFKPDLKVIAGHNHLSQTFSVNTPDTSLSQPVLAFIHRTVTFPPAE